MTALVRTRTPARIWTDAPAFAGATVLLVLALLPLFAAMALDERSFQGDSPWLKPVKFHIALALYLGTLAFLSRFLPGAMREGRGWRVFAGAVVLATLGEVLWLSGAATINAASHFNTDHALLRAVYPVMGVLAVLLTSASLVMGLAIARNRATGLPPALRLSVALGLILTFAMTVPLAGYLSQAGGHFVGTSTRELWLMGWSRDAGDLRVAHFLSTHALHALPLAGLLAQRLMPARAVPLVWAAALGYVALTVATFLQALAGQPFLAALG